MYTNQERKFHTWAKSSNGRVNYIFTQSLKYNVNTALLKTYNRPQVVWVSTRVDYTKRQETKTRRSDSISRARERLYDLVQANLNTNHQMTTFITLTFKENITDISLANTYFKAFIRRLNNYFAFKVKYISVVEFQKRGAVHYHVLFFNLPFFNIHEFEELWGHGYTNVQALHNIDNVAAYVAKYLSKETFDSRLVGQKVYFSSRNLLRPVITRDNIEISNQLTAFRPIDAIISQYVNLTKYERKCISDFC